MREIILSVIFYATAVAGKEGNVFFKSLNDDYF